MWVWRPGPSIRETLSYLRRAYVFLEHVHLPWIWRGCVFLPILWYGTEEKGAQQQPYNHAPHKKFSAVRTSNKPLMASSAPSPCLKRIIIFSHQWNFILPLLLVYQVARSFVSTSPWNNNIMKRSAIRLFFFAVVALNVCMSEEVVVSRFFSVCLSRVGLFIPILKLFFFCFLTCFVYIEAQTAACHHSGNRGPERIWWWLEQQ